jgi:endonuclease-8
VPEGDTLKRTAAGLRPYLVGRAVTAVRVRLPGPQADRLVGATVTDVEAYGKQLLIRFDSGLELRSHLGMHGSWHRYAPGERWRRAPGRARFVMEVPGAVAVCFGAPTLELFETRIEAIHPVLARLGPDILAADFGPADADESRRRLRASAAAHRSIAEGLLVQRAVAGIGNVDKHETLVLERVDPFAPIDRLEDATVDRLVATARRLMLPNVRRVERITTEGQRAAGGQSAWVYRRVGRPCRRCGTLIQAERHGELPRATYWCPTCQVVGRAGAPNEAALPTEPGAAITTVGSAESSGPRPTMSTRRGTAGS